MTATNTPLAAGLMTLGHYATARGLALGLVDRLIREHRDALIDAGALNAKHSFAAGCILVDAMKLDAFREDRCRKELDTLRADLARRGYVVNALDGGRFLVRRWCHTREVDLAGLQDFAKRAGA